MPFAIAKQVSLIRRGKLLLKVIDRAKQVESTHHEISFGEGCVVVNLPYQRESLLSTTAAAQP